VDEMKDDTDSRQAANGLSNTLTLGYLTYHVTAMSQPACKVNKVLLAQVMLFKLTNFWPH